MKLGNLVSGGRTEMCGPEYTLTEAAKTMSEVGVASLAVIDGAKLAGIITEHDIVRAAGEEVDLSQEIVSSWMSGDPDVFSPDVDVKEAAVWLLETGYRHLPVVDDGDLLGIVSVRDVMWVLTGPGSELS